jgi:N-acetylglucosamine-6-sulfatase
MPATDRTRARLALAIAVACLGLAASTPAAPAGTRDSRPNIVVILSDDQSFDTLPSEPPAMPYLQASIADPADHWLWFPNAFINTPLCCPSRATILTGLYSHHTGVTGNHDGHLLDETATLPVWLHDAGYTTAMIGKYLNQYPWSRGPYVPPGWDRFVAKRNTAKRTTYYGYGFVDQGVPMRVADAPSTYATDFFGDRAVDFIRTAPEGRPFFLYYAPSAPHPPWTPAPGDAGTFAGLAMPSPPNLRERGLDDKPAWVRNLPAPTRASLARLADERRRERETLLDLDEAVRRIVDALRTRSALDDTVIVFLTDNGYSFGEHRIVGKRCPYEECVRTPLAVRMPGADAGVADRLVSNADLAPTLAALAGVAPSVPTDGRSFAGVLEDSLTHGPGAVLLEWAGDADIPPWWAVRTADFAYIESDDGTVELYDLTGRLGRADPFELDSRAGDPAYSGTVVRLARLLDALRHAGDRG